MEQIEINKNLKKGTITVITDFCLMCGKRFDDSLKRTKHHGIQQALKPKTNVICYLCCDCHKKQSKKEQQYKRFFNVLSVMIKNINNSAITMEKLLA